MDWEYLAYLGCALITRKTCREGGKKGKKKGVLNSISMSSTHNIIIYIIER